VATAIVAFALAGCSGSSSVESERLAPESSSVQAAATAAPEPTTIAPSGDDDLDSLDAELTAFEEEYRGLDSAVAATEEN
jgi:ABC-type glycerol-3-phosphate transport system substrate-binding protein